jgi:Tol biopolymer transport system component
VGLDGKQKRSLLPEATVPQGVSDDQPEWARDAKTIVYARRIGTGSGSPGGGRGGQLEIWVAYADGSNARRLVGGLNDPGVNTLGVVEYDVVYDFQP